MPECGEIITENDFVFVWRLDKFPTRVACFTDFQSPYFEVNDNNGKYGTLNLRIHPKGDNETSANFSIYVSKATNRGFDFKFR